MILPFFNFFSFSDSAVFQQYGFQDPATPIMEGLIDLHHHIFFFLIIILIFVVWVISKAFIYFYIYPEILIDELNRSGDVLCSAAYVARRKNLVSTNVGGLAAFEFGIHKVRTHVLVSKFLKSVKVTHDYLLEIVWTLVPSFILILIAIPSFALLYAMDEVVTPAITLKVIGRQWYWSYEYSDYYLTLLSEGSSSSLNFDSYMIPEDELAIGQLRLLEVDNPVVLPINTHIRVIISAADVLHAWAIPSLGVKMDAVPGRLNQASLFIKRPGTYYGQCSEICGVNHGFMPIVIEALPVKNYLAWVSSKLA